MNNIKAIVYGWNIQQLKDHCANHGIQFAHTERDVKDVPPEETLLIRHKDHISHSETVDLIQKGFKIGVLLSEDRQVFHGLPDWGAFEEFDVGVINLTTGETITWEVEDTYDADRAAWVAEHAGTRTCSSCGCVMNEDRDFSHACGDDICYMCS